MSNQLYAKTPKTVTPETPGQRNRRLLIKALTAGVSVVKETSEGYYVSSATKPGVAYLVQLDASDDAQNIIQCNCSWGTKFGWMLDSKDSPMCSHMTVIRWYRADLATQAHTINLHPEIAAALVAGGHIQLTPAEHRDFADAVAGITELDLGLFIQHIGAATLQAVA